jgi:hypothetical protein
MHCPKAVRLKSTGEALLMCLSLLSCGGSDGPDETLSATLEETPDLVDPVAATARQMNHPSAVDMWVWQSEVVTDEHAQRQFFHFAANKGVRTAYIASSKLLDSDSSTYGEFIDTAKQKGLTVELLFGESSWALKSNHAEAVAVTTSAIQFIQGLSGCKPVGIHFDIEPYTLPEWTTDMNRTANQFLDLLVSVHKKTERAKVRLTVDVPYWYYSRMVTRNGETRSMIEWVLDIADRIAIFDYTHDADDLIRLGTPEMDAAKSANKPAVIGVNVKCPAEKTTFCGEGQKVLSSAFGTTKRAFVGYPLDGFAVEAYSYWLTLDP